MEQMSGKETMRNYVNKTNKVNKEGPLNKEGSAEVLYRWQTFQRSSTDGKFSSQRRQNIFANPSLRVPTNIY